MACPPACGGCNHQCVKTVAKTPEPTKNVPVTNTPTDEKCTPYSEPKMCIALAGVCYNAATCGCDNYAVLRCAANPCDTASCNDGLKCECTQDTLANCLVDPCTAADCKDGYECVANYCGGCNHQCVKTVAKTPEPTKNVPVTNTPTECVDEAACACTEEGLRAAQREAGRTRQQDCGGLQHLQLLGRDARLHQDGVPSCREVHTVL
eukprot:TRINITY_DN10184_c0_g1_i5.p2 TRINITY_DN10184_c0_g1~~TRINITY_DN10184_c0_g1_i5.p2  ORF type:complete len:227 (+),score=47.90 TRINITY_DN10184_c0_g1_i5:61-681(+)